MKAKNREEFVQAWTRHVEELRGLVVQVADPHAFRQARKYYAVLRARADSIISIAAADVFPDEDGDEEGAEYPSDATDYA